MVTAAETVRPCVTPLEALRPFALVGLEGISNSIAIVDLRSDEEIAVLTPADFRQAWTAYGMNDPMARAATLTMNPRLAKRMVTPPPPRTGLLDRTLFAWGAHPRWGWTFFYAMGAIGGFSLRGLLP